MEPKNHQELEAIRQKKFAESYKVKTYEQNIVKDVDTTKRVVTGISNMFYFFDSDWDVLIPGSTTKSITERGPQSNVPGKIKHALFHDLTKLPSKVQILDERKMPEGFGQYFETKMLNTNDGNDTLIKYQEGVYDNHSIGFRYLDIEMIDEESDNWKKWLDQLINPEDAETAGFMFLVKEIKQYEFSTVAFGANALTPYLGVKAENKEAVAIKLMGKLEAMEKQLRHGSKLTDDGFYSLELEILQIKQLLSEILFKEPSIKDTLLQGRYQKDTHAKGMALTVCTNCFTQCNYSTEDKNAKCPSCGQFVNKGPAITTDFDLSKAIKETTFITI